MPPICWFKTIFIYYLIVSARVQLDFPIKVAQDWMKEMTNSSFF